MTRRMAAVVLAFAAMGWGACGSAGALEPGEVVVLFNSKSPRSLQVAQYYMHARKIPRENLVAVNCTDTEWMSAEEYRESVVPQVRKGLADRKLEGQVKCLVTTYGMPLAIGDAVQTAAVRAEVMGYQKQLGDLLNQMAEQVGAYEALGVKGEAATQTSSPPTTAKAAGAQTWQAIVQRLNVAASAAAKRIDALDAQERQPLMLTMAKLQEKVAGIGGVLASFQIKDNTPGAERGHEYLNGLQEKLRGIEEQLQAMVKEKERPEARAKMIELQRAGHGLVGEARQLEATIQFLSPKETGASFDNELALVLAAQDYPRGRWLPNARNIELYPQLEHATGLPQPLLVTRLDGATESQVCKMIDTGLKVEKTGLDGKIYLDARGLHGNDGYAVFDADLRRAADWLKEHSTMDVVLDDTPALMQAAHCPDAALYCGWYSLHTYVNSCQWVPGGVGYHVASLEMPSLHKPKETGWVVNLLNRGYVGTLGAVAEPYLTAFPKPSQFFPLLMSGEFTQGEVWEVTAPMVSWQIGYVGDPLYNPFKARPQVKVEDLKADVVLRNAFAILGR